MNEYTLSSGERFQTLRIPKGTLLFRGIDMNIDKPHPEFIFTDLFGMQDEDGYYCVDPHENKFFYPAPFVSDSVGRYAVHMVLHTNYDLEVVLLLNPSENSRSKRGTAESSVLRCSDISEKDACGKRRQTYDPCLSPLLIREYPHIQGYIAIAEKDTRVFQKGQIPSFMQNIPEAVEFVRPFIVSDRRGMQGVPEIVLFPFHTRPEGYEQSLIHPRAVWDNQYAWAIRHRAALNYFPLAFVTEKDIYGYKDLLQPARLKELSESQRDNINFDSPLVKNMIRFMNAGLQKNGLYIDNIPYTFSIDLRTGFYVVDIPETRRLNYTIRKIPMNSPEYDSEPRIVPFHYPVELKKQLHASLRKSTEESLSRNLNRLYASYTKLYPLNKGNPDTFKAIYKMELAVPRPELDIPKRHYTRKQKRNTVRKS